MFNENVGSRIFSPDSAMGNNAESGGGPASANGANHAGAIADMGKPNGPDIASQADVLLELINELKSITERACDAAVRESECAERIEETKDTEVADLQVRLKETEKALAAREAVLTERDEMSKTKIQALEIELRNRQGESKVREVEVEDLKAKLGELTKCLQDAEVKAREGSERRQAEMNDLRRQLQETQAELRVKDDELIHADGDLKAKNEDLESRLQDIESQLQNREAELKEKENLIQAAAAKEAEIGKLISRLSEECGKLSAELHEKSLIVAQLEKKQRHFMGDGTVWKKVLGRMKEEAV